MSILPQSLTLPLRHLLDRCHAALLPGSCLLCGGDGASHLLCPPCLAELPAMPAGCCPQCGEASALGERCGACLKKPPHFDRTVALWRYDFPLDRIVQAMKYRQQTAVARWFGEQLASALEADGQCVVPMPLHPERLRERGFNQSTEMARRLARRLHLPLFADCLRRQRPTPPQAGLDQRQRRRNVRGAFICNADLDGRAVLLVDDVMTTGASADECARVLRRHGAGAITVVVAARALKPGSVL